MKKCRISEKIVDLFNFDSHFYISSEILKLTVCRKSHMILLAAQDSLEKRVRFYKLKISEEELDCLKQLINNPLKINYL